MSDILDRLYDGIERWQTLNNMKPAVALLRDASVEIEQHRTADAAARMADAHGAGHEGGWADAISDALALEGRKRDNALAFRAALAELKPSPLNERQPTRVDTAVLEAEIEMLGFNGPARALRKLLTYVKAVEARLP